MGGKVSGVVVSLATLGYARQDAHQIVPCACAGIPEGEPEPEPEGDSEPEPEPEIAS